MTVNQQEIAELLCDLKRPAEAIAANSGIPVETVKTWLKSGKWPAVNTQRSLFELAGEPPLKRRNPQPLRAVTGFISF